MNSIDAFKHYKHDVSGKFTELAQVIESFDENAFGEKANYEMFHAIHEAVVKMMRSSKKFLQENLQQEMVLKVSKALPAGEHSKFTINGVTIRLEYSEKQMTYFLNPDESELKEEEAIAVIQTLFPMKSVVRE